MTKNSKVWRDYIGYTFKIYKFNSNQERKLFRENNPELHEYLKLPMEK